MLLGACVTHRKTIKFAVNSWSIHSYLIKPFEEVEGTPPSKS